MGPKERDPEQMIADGMLEKIDDFDHNGQTIPASRLGYRITRKFVRTYLARVFDNPSKVFTEEILKPELQDPESFADGILYIAEAQQRVAKTYFDDGGYEFACPPLKAILDIMANGEHQGKTIEDPEIRNLFTRESLVASDWYQRRLTEKRHRDIDHWKAFEQRIAEQIEASSHRGGAGSIDLQTRLQYAEQMRANAESANYEQELVGTLGADPMRPSTEDASMLNRLAEAT
jgi:hypothetical protein